MNRRSFENQIRDLFPELGSDDWLDPFMQTPMRIRGDRKQGEWQEWESVLDTFVELGSKRSRKAAKKLKDAEVDVTFFHPGGVVTAEVVARDNIFDAHIEIDFERFMISKLCSCGDEDSVCEHIILLAQHVKANFADFGIGESKLTDADPKLFKILDQLLEHQITVESVVLPPEKKQAQTRIVWRLLTKPYVSLVPIQQKLNKKGTAWTKGKKLKFDTVYQSPERYQCTDIDQDVLACSESGYYHEARVNVLDALDCLVGHDLFQIDAEPGEVVRRSLALRVELRLDLWQLRIDVDGRSPKSYLFYENGLIAFDGETSRIAIIRCDPMLARMAEALVTESVGCSDATVHQLMERVEKLRQFIPVTLPEKLGGKCVTDESALVLQLRARESGGLDVAVRVRDSLGRLARPGEGLLRYPGERDGKPVQLVRDAQAERDSEDQLIRELQLDKTKADQEFFSVDDLDDSLALLARTEKAATEQRCEIAWDPSSIQRLSVLGHVTSKNVQVQITKKKDWFGISGNIRIGETELPLADLLNSLSNRSHGRFIEIQPGAWAEFNDAFRKQLEELREVVHTNRSQLSIDSTAASVVRKLDDGHAEFKASKDWRDCLSRLDRSEELNPDPAPTFQATLRDYQLEGYRWLRRLAEWRVGACLADDMGLGKTIQMLAVLVDRRTDGPTLVVAPTSVGFNWLEETLRFAPDLKPILYRESERSELLKSVGPGDVVICSYGLTLRDAKPLSEVKWATMVLDEAQAIKNSRSKTAMAIRDLQADWKVALTGTPMENHLGELWSLFRAISPGVLGSWDRFRDRFATPIEKHNDNDRRKALARVLKPFVLRRTKSEVLTELPERTEINLYVDLNDGERAAYDQMRLSAAGELEQIEELTNTGDQRFRILALLTRMRQLACHRRLVDPTWSGSSAKLDMLIEKLQELRDEGHRALVFSQFTSHLALIREACDAAKITYQYLDGKSSPKSRKKSVEAFQSGEGDAFLISLKAGGTGLNITAADYVIHTDPWWNPAVEDQATDRAHRIGQTRPVMVYRMIARGTIEETILELHKDKRDLVNGILEGSEAAAKLSTAELAKLIRT
jgi:SNF2 family DNA or RNA helicase